LITISGKIEPVENLTDAGVSIDFVMTGDAGAVIQKKRSTSANNDGTFFYKLDCSDVDKSGFWRIQTSWEGNDCLKAAVSDFEMLTVNRATCKVTLDLTRDAIKVGETISISGLFKPSPMCGVLTGKDITLFITSDGRVKAHQLKTNDRFGHFQLKDYADFKEIGEYIINAMYQEDDAYFSDMSDSMTLEILESAGYAIIVQGQIASGEGTASYSKTTMFVRDQLENRGILDNEEYNDIMYFNYDVNHPKVDAKPTKKAIKNAIVKWAKERIKTQPGNLYIVLVNHGLEEQFFIYPEVITSQDIKQWLDELQQDPKILAQHIVLILGFCHSGSFIDDLAGYHRIVIASAAANEFSYKGPLDKDNIREGEFFVSEFFKKIALGKNIRKSFHDAVVLTETFTQSMQIGSINAPPYFDRSEQHPLLDDNGDGIGSNNILESNTDGKDSELLIIGVSSLTHNAPGDVTLDSVAPTIFLDDPNQFPDNCFWAKLSTIEDSFNLRSIWIEIKSPEYDIKSSESGQKELLLPKILGGYNEENERYEWHWEDIISKENFEHPGIYQVFYFAKDDRSENVSPFMETKVYRNTLDNQWPSEFQLQSPENETTLTIRGFFAYCEDDTDPDCYPIFTWTESYDPDNEELTYNILLSPDDNTFSNKMRIIDTGNITQSPIDMPLDWDGKTIFWKVRAVDSKGGRYETETWQFKLKNFGNPPVGRVKGYVCDAETGEILPHAKLRMESLDVRLVRGYYLVAKKPITYSFQASCEGYEKYEGSVQFVVDKTILNPILLQPQFLLGDIDGSEQVNLRDAILALKIMGNIEVFYNINLHSDVDGDGEIGEVEAIYILQYCGRILE